MAGLRFAGNLEAVCDAVERNKLSVDRVVAVLLNIAEADPRKLMGAGRPITNN